MVKTSVRRRRLPLVAAIGHEEFFGSWIDRLAVDHGLTRSEIWTAIGVTDQASDFPINYGITLSREVLDQITETTGVSHSRIRHALLERYDGTALDMASLSSYSTAPPWARNLWAHVGSTSACPECVSETDGQWQTQWKLAWIFGCPTHSGYLCPACPACGTRWQSRPRDHRQTTVCANHSERTTGRSRADTKIICGFRAADAPVTRINDQAAKRILVELAAACDGAAIPNELSARELFTDLIDICRLVFNVAPPGLLDKGTDSKVAEAFAMHAQERDDEQPRKGKDAKAGFRSYRHTPSNPLLLAAALKLAWPIVTTADPSERVHDLIAAGIETPAGRIRWGQLRKHWKPPPRLESTFTDAHLRATYTGGASFDGRSRYVRATKTDNNLGSRVPQLLWDEAFDILAERVPTLRRCQYRPGRQFAAMAVLRTLDPQQTSWSDAADFLGLEQHYNKSSHKIHRILIANGEGDVFNSTIDEISAAVVDDPKCLDYKQRRDALSNFDSIDPAAWQTMLADAGCRRTASTYRWPAQATAWLWVMLTHGDFYLAPSLLIGQLEGQKRETEAQAYRVYFAANPLPVLEASLVQHAVSVLERYGLEGPLTYTPTFATTS